MFNSDKPLKKMENGCKQSPQKSLNAGYRSENNKDKPPKCSLCKHVTKSSFMFDFK